MISDAVKVARIQARSRRDEAQIQLARELIRNPVIELLAGICAISYLNKGSQSWLETATGIDLAAGGEYAGLVAIIGMQQIAPLVPSMMAQTGDIAKALPSVLALGAGL